MGYPHLEKPTSPHTFTIDQWCERRQISRAMYYKLDRENRAPRTFKVGAKKLISEQADADWVREREAEAQAAREIAAA